MQLLLRRLSHVEEIHKKIVTEDEDMCTYLTEGQYIHEAQNRRKIIHYYDKIVQGKSPLTIRNIDNVENIFELGT